MKLVFIGKDSEVNRSSLHSVLNCIFHYESLIIEEFGIDEDSLMDFYVGCESFSEIISNFTKDKHISNCNLTYLNRADYTDKLCVRLHQLLVNANLVIALPNRGRMSKVELLMAEEMNLPLITMPCMDYKLIQSFENTYINVL